MSQADVSGNMLPRSARTYRLLYSRNSPCVYFYKQPALVTEAQFVL